MGLVVQITDTHILAPGELLYGATDTETHLRGAIQQINAMRPQADVTLITGDLVERPDRECYRHFLELISPLKMPTFVLPGNHDDPDLMAEFFAGTPHFPAQSPTYQYVIDDFPYRILALNSHAPDSGLPDFDAARLAWVDEQLSLSEKPTLVAIHHPPMITSIELVDIRGPSWFQKLAAVLSKYPQVKLVICGHSHADMTGRIAHVPVYMASAVAHQLVAARGLTIAPSYVRGPAPPVLHHFLNGEFLSGSNPWPADAEEMRIDKTSGIEWGAIKDHTRGSLK